MEKVWIAPYDFLPRDPSELSFSRHDRIRISVMDQGWCWGCNLSQNGKEGWFPKIYASYSSRTSSPALDRIIRQTASVCCQIDVLIADSMHLTSDDDRRSLLERQRTLNSIGPFTYLISATATGIWEMAFRSFLGAFEEGKVPRVDYVMLVGRFRHLAGQLDKHVASLGEEVRKHPKLRPSLLDNALQMQATLGSLLEVASLALKASSTARCDGFLSSPPSLSTTSRPPTLTSAHGSAPGSPPPRLPRTATMESVIFEPPAAVAPGIHAAFLGYQTLRNLTFIVSLAACALQLQAFMLAPHEPGRAGTPDFFNNVQSLLMQLLTTYTSLVPALRGRWVTGGVVGVGVGDGNETATTITVTDDERGREREEERGERGGSERTNNDNPPHPHPHPPHLFVPSAFWCALLFVACVVLNLASLAVYFAYSSPLAQLLSFFGTVVQAITVLQLTLRVVETSVDVDFV